MFLLNAFDQRSVSEENDTTINFSSLCKQISEEGKYSSCQYIDTSYTQFKVRKDLEIVLPKQSINMGCSQSNVFVFLIWEALLKIIQGQLLTVILNSMD